MHINTLKAGDNCDVIVHANQDEMNLKIGTGETTFSMFRFDRSSARALAEHIINALDNTQQGE